jgi:hypothetical protein
MATALLPHRIREANKVVDMRQRSLELLEVTGAIDMMLVYQLMDLLDQVPRCLHRGFHPEVLEDTAVSAQQTKTSIVMT